MLYIINHYWQIYIWLRSNKHSNSFLSMYEEFLYTKSIKIRILMYRLRHYSLFPTWFPKLNSLTFFCLLMQASDTINTYSVILSRKNILDTFFFTKTENWPIKCGQNIANELKNSNVLIIMPNGWSNGETISDICEIMFIWILQHLRSIFINRWELLQ